MQMEVSFGSMSEWEDFLSQIPFQEHKAWTQRIQSMVVDGSPKWEVHRSVPLLQATGSSTNLEAAAARPPTTTGQFQQTSFLQMPITGNSSFEEEVGPRAR